MKLSFIIVNYQSEKYLVKCLSSIKEKVLSVDYEIIVVNNDLEVQLPNDLGARLLSEIRLINTGKNIGFGAGCNVGAKISQGEILCFLNPDTEIIKNNISDILDKFNQDKNVGVIGPRLIDEAGKTQEWIAGKEVTILSTVLNNLGYKRDKKIWESDVSVECAWISGAASFIRKEIFQKLGGFDEKFFMYFEDINLCKRARQLDYKVLYYPGFIIKHFSGKSFLDKKEQKRYYRKSQRIYFGKYLSK
jgi:N-acetylglucosaminyl-diphospho-decaprenol L-rhamnosyltransferase